MTDHQDDHQLLVAYARENSETAFAALVTRYLGLVYSAALRHSGNAHGAEEIAQAVFIILARKAGGVSERTVLSGWLYQTTRLTAANYLRAEQRRQQREQEAYMQSALNETESGSDAAWMQIAPLLDDALAGLGARDRDAIVLRFFENKSAREIAIALRVEEATAHKRVSRAVAKLRTYFAKRGVALSDTVIAGTMTANSVQTVPTALAKSISTVAAAKGVTATTSTLILVETSIKTMNWTKLKFTVSIGLAIILLTGATTTLVAQHFVPPGDDITYKMLDDACQFTEGFDQTKLIVRMIILSQHKPADPAVVHLTIQSIRKGSIPVQLGRMGQILNFPHAEALRRENPNVIANLPKGTYGPTVWCFLPMPDALSFPYSHLGDAVAEANKGIERANELIKASYSGQIPPIKEQVRGVVFVFGQSGADKAKIEIASASGKKAYTANKAGNVFLRLDKSLLAENPQVVLSQKAEYVALDHIPWRR